MTTEMSGFSVGMALVAVAIDMGEVTGQACSVYITGLADSCRARYDARSLARRPPIPGVEVPRIRTERPFSFDAFFETFASVIMSTMGHFQYCVCWQSFM